MPESIKPKKIKKLVVNTRQVLKEPILQVLLDRSTITETQMETLLIDLVLEDNIEGHIDYETKATYRATRGTKKKGVSRGAFNRTLKQARTNVTKSIYTLLLLAYLGLFDLAVFRPFEEIASRIGGYRRIREILSGKIELTSEELESYQSAERHIISLLEELDSPFILKNEIAKQRL
jgi:hypothetical protein